MAKERNPMHEAGAGQIGSILHNESKGGKVIGMERRTADVEERETTESGIIVGEKKLFADIVLEQFDQWSKSPLPKITLTPFTGYVCELFWIIFPKSAKQASDGTVHYDKTIFPIVRVVAVGKFEDGSRGISPGHFIKVTNEVCDYGVSLLWQQWFSERNQSDIDTENRGEPAYYGGFIDDWQIRYGCAPNLLMNNYTHNSIFVLPFQELQGLLNIEEMQNILKTTLDEIKQN